MGGRTGDGQTELIQRNIYYKSLPSQRLFHQSNARFKGFSGPIGSGKSQALVQEAIRLSYQNGGRLGLIGAPTYPMLRDATLAQLAEALEDNRLPFDLNKSEFFITMKDTGSKILLRSLDDFERLRGTNLAWFGVDELSYCQEEAWLRLEGRLRDPKAKQLCGYGVWTPKGFDWVYRRFISEAVSGYEVIKAKAYENRYILDQIPDFYDRLKGSYDERFYAQEVLGDYLNIVSDGVYQGFDRTVNVQPGSIHRRLPLLWALDFNVDPMSSVVAQRRGDDFHILDEIQLKRVSTEEACMEFLNRYKSHRSGLIIYGDASGNSTQTTSGSSDYKVLRSVFKREAVAIDVRVRPANPPVKERVGAVNAALRNAAGESHLFIDPKCKELIKDLEEVCYQENTTTIDKSSDPRRTHLSDAMGYMVWQETEGKRYKVGPRGRPLIAT